MKERHKIIPASMLVLIKDGKVLLSKRKGSSYYDGWYGLSSGHVEKNELPVAAIIREAKEEIGITLLPENLSFIHLHYGVQKGWDDYCYVFFKAEVWAGEVENVEPEKCEELLWVGLKEIPENTIPYIKFALEKIENKPLYTETEVNADKK